MRAMPSPAGTRDRGAAEAATTVPGLASPSRLDPAPLDGILDSDDLGRLAAALVGAGGITGMVDPLVATARHRVPAGYHPDLVMAVCAAAVVTMVVLLARPRLLTTRRTPGFITVAMIGVTVAAYGAGAQRSPFATLFYVWSACAFVFLPWRQAVTQVALTAVLHGSLLAVQPGHANVTGEWLFTGGVTVLTAVVVHRMVTALLAIAGAEQGARTLAERGRADVERLSREKSEFLVRTSHEMRTPLNSIIGFADMLGDGLVGPLNPQQADYVEEVRTSGRHLLDVIGDVLDLAKVESGHQELQLDRFSVVDLLAGARTLLGPAAERRGVELDLRGVHADAVLRADERKVRQVVLNLLSNAVKFAPPGGSVIVTSGVSGAMVAISVADNGPGVASEDRERIFEEYRQASGGAAPGVGTGLGLPLARRFAQIHGGTLDLESRPGVGSTFTLRLPLDGPSPGARIAGEGRVQGEIGWAWARRRPLDYPDLRRRLASLPAILAVGCAVLGGLTVALSALHQGGTAARPGRLLVLAVLGAAGAVAGAVVSSRPTVLRGGRTSIMLVSATIAITVAGFNVGNREQPVAAMLYVWVGVGAVIVVSRRAAALHVLFVAASYATLLALQSGNTDPGARWLIVVAVVVVSAVTMDLLVVRVSALALAERRACLDVERVRMELEEANRHKGAFLAAMSHELRTPLNAIIGFSDLLVDELFGPLSDKQLEYARDLAESGRQLLALINDVLDLAKIDAGRMELDLSDHVDVAGVARRACERGGSPAPIVEVSVERGPLVARADEHKLERLVADLVTQQVDDSGSVTVRVGRRDDGGLFVDVLGAGSTSRALASTGAPPLRVALAGALAAVQGGCVVALGSGLGWRLVLPATPDVARRAEPLIEGVATGPEPVIGEAELARSGLLMGAALVLMDLVAIATVIVRPLHGPHGAVHRLPLLGLVAAGTLFVTLVHRSRRTWPSRSVPWVLVGGVAALTVEAWLFGPRIAPYVTMPYIWIGMAASLCLRRTAAWSICAVVGVAYAGLLVAQPGNPAPITQWTIVMGLVLASGSLTASIAARIRHLTAEERRLRSEVESGRQALVVAQSARAEFLAGMSHELRTPLNAIIGFADVLDEHLFGGLSAVQQQLVHGIRSAGSILVGLVDELLDVDGGSPPVTADLSPPPDPQSAGRRRRDPGDGRVGYALDRLHALPADMRRSAPFFLLVPLSVATVIRRPPPGLHVGWVFAVTGVGLVADTVILCWSRVPLEARAPAHLALTVAVSLGIAAAEGAALAPFSTMVLVCLATAAAIRLPTAQAVGILAGIAVGVAILVATQAGNAEPFVRWEMTIGTAAVSAMVIRSIVTRMFGLAEAEARIRATADSGRRDLEVADRHKVEFLRRVRQDLRPPIDTVTAAASALASVAVGPLGPKQVEYASDIAGAGHHLWALVTDILDLATVEAGGMAVEPGDLSLAALLGDSASTFVPQARASGVELEVAIAPGLDRVWADEDKLGRAVAGLISNAIKFTHRGGAVLVAAGSDGGALRIAVSDTGPGIPDRDRDRIFEGFEQGGPSDSAAGAGVGLTLAQRFVELQGGRVELETEAGVGSTFTIVLPQPGRAEDGAVAGAGTVGDQGLRSVGLRSVGLRSVGRSSPVR